MDKILKVIWSCKTNEQLGLVKDWINRLHFDPGDSLSDYGIKSYYINCILEMHKYLNRG